MTGCLLRYGFLALALVALPAGAQLYKWTDANGRVQYSDKPPPPGKTGAPVSQSRVSTVPGSSAGGPASAPKSAADGEQDFRKRQAEQEEAQKKQQKLAEEQRGKQANCQAAQRQLTAMQSGQRMAVFDEKGERRFLDDNEIQQAIQKGQQDVQRLCN